MSKTGRTALFFKYLIVVSLLLYFNYNFVLAIKNEIFR